MKYIYMNNIRGFKEALIPIRTCNFLVGENSTGKSSFLSALNYVSKPDFLFSPKLYFGEPNSPSPFLDLVSAWSDNKTNFDIGVIDTEETQGSQRLLSYSIQRFTNIEGQPTVSQLIHKKRGRIIHLRFTKALSEYCTSITSTGSAETEVSIVRDFKSSIRQLDGNSETFKRMPPEFSGYPPIGIALSVIPALEDGINSKEFKIEFPINSKITWIAPIRSKPNRIYYGRHKGYSAEGDHSPFILKQQLKSKSFVDTLKNFGSTSGLFEVISTHTFGRGRDNPFEVMIKLSGQSFNINNVGYGVSQVIPLIVEFLSNTGERFAVQQPEVHLHPKAQAALGSLVFHLIKEKKHQFTVETHSDYMIDRFRLEMRKAKNPPDCQVIFFSRGAKGNTALPMRISKDGKYPERQPMAFRDFFINEEFKLASI